jgi:hypothetical protein
MDFINPGSLGVIKAMREGPNAADFAKKEFLEVPSSGLFKIMQPKRVH